MVRVMINGHEHELDGGATVLDGIAAAGAAPDRVAVALNGEVVPRSTWATTPLAEQDRIEVVTAMQGGS